MLSLFLQKLKDGLGGRGGGSGDSGVIFFRVSPESRVQSRVLSSPVQLLGHATIWGYIKLNLPDLLSQMEQQIKICELHLTTISGSADLKLMFEPFLSAYLQLLAQSSNDIWHHYHTFCLTCHKPYYIVMSIYFLSAWNLGKGPRVQSLFISFCPPAN